jgi:hypothetical protein
VKPARHSPGLARRRGSRVATSSRRQERSSKVAVLDLGEEGNECGENW